MNAPNLTLLVVEVVMDAKTERFAVHVHLAEEVICVLKHLVQGKVIGKFQKSATRIRTRLLIMVKNYTENVKLELHYLCIMVLKS